MFGITPLILLVFVAAQQQDVDELIRQLSSNDAAVRDEATQKLKALGKKAVPSLEKAAKSKDKEAAARARFVLRVFDVQEILTPNLKKAMKGIVDRLASGNEHTWTEVFLELADGARKSAYRGDLRRADLETLVVQAARGADSASERERVCIAAWYFSLRTAVPEIIPWLQDESAHVKIYTADHLGLMRAKSAAPRIAELLEDEDDLVVSHAAQALGRLGYQEATPRLRELLKHESAQRRIGAAIALAQMGAADAKEDLISALDDGHAVVRARAVDALANYRAHDSVESIAKLGQDQRARVRWYVARSLGRLGGERSVSVIRKLLEDEDAGVRFQACIALARLGDKESMSEIEKLFPNATPSGRFQIASSLCRLGSQKGVPHLFEALEVFGGGRLFSLNAVRRPDVWKRLMSKRLSRDIEGSTREVLTQVAQEAGLRLEYPEPKTIAEEGWTAFRWRMRNRSSQASLLDILDDLRQPGYQPILESDRIRMVPYAEATKFWRSWWAEEQKKR